jgi:Ca-activated chloride channel family protein
MIHHSFWSKKFARNARRVASLVGVASLIFAILYSPVSQHAQSGRNRPEPATNKSSISSASRAKQAGTTSTQQKQSTSQRNRTATTATDNNQPSNPSSNNAPAPNSTPERSTVTPAPRAEPPAMSAPQTSQKTPATSGATPTISATPNPAGEEVDPEDVVRINSNLVTIPASVIDATGKSITDLKLTDFELRVDGQPRPIAELGRSETPVHMALLFDNSMSLLAAREFEKQAAMQFFRSVMRPIDQAAIYSIYTYPILAQPLTSDVNMLVRTIERFPKPEDGATALFDTILQAATYLRPFQGRKVIVIVSDGVETTSTVTELAPVLQKLQATDCQVFAVQTGQIENANLRDLVAERRLQEMTSQTGGAVYVPKSTSDLDAAFAQISADLAQQYVLSYYPTDDRRDGRFRIIGLRVATRQNLRVRARRGYYAPKG